MQEATQNPGEHELDVLAERFFSQPPQAWEIEPEEWRLEPLSSIQRVAMLTTAAPAMAVLAVAVTLLFAEPLFLAWPAPSVEPAQAAARAPEAAVQAPPAVATAVAVVMPAPVAAPVQVVEPVIDRAIAPSAATAVPRKAAVKTSAAAKRARRLLDAGHAQAARDLARDAIRNAPNQAAGYIVLAGALDKLGDRAGMIATFRTCAQVATDKLASACRSFTRVR